MYIEMLIDLFRVFLQFSDSTLNEVMRLTSGVFMVRGVTKDTTFEMEDGSKFNIRAGDRIAMYPPAIHKDPEIYEDPLVGINRLCAYCKGGNFNIHIWAWFGCLIC